MAILKHFLDAILGIRHYYQYWCEVSSIGR